MKEIARMIRLVERFVKICKRDAFIIVFLYCLAHGFLLFVTGIYWDDWTLYNVDSESIIDAFNQAGQGESTLWAHFHNFFLSFENFLWLYRLLAFFCYLFAALLLYKILSTIKEIHPASKLFIVLIFMLIPVNNVRIALINAPYGVGYFLFFLGFWFLSQYFLRKQFSLRIMALIVFILSFSIHSLLVFYIIVMIYIFYCERRKITIPSFVSITIKYLDFLFLPIVFWIIRSIYWVPIGIREGYNEVDFNGLLVAPLPSILAFYYSFIDVMNHSFSFLSSIPFTVMLWTIFFAFMIQKSISQHSNDILFSGNDKTFFLFGLFSFFVAVYPYNVVGKFPWLGDWASRHQLLVPLGSAFICYYGIQIVYKKVGLNKRNYQIIIFSFFISLFIVTNVQNYIHFQKDWYKQLSLIENFKSSTVIRSNSTFIFKDNTPNLNANKRTYRFYEYTGLMKNAFNDEIRFGEDITRFTSIDDYKLYMNERYYNLKDYYATPPQFIVTINYGTYDLDRNINFFKLKYYELFNKEKFYEEIKTIVVLETESLK